MTDAKMDVYRVDRSETRVKRSLRFSRRKTAPNLINNLKEKAEKKVSTSVFFAPSLPKVSKVKRNKYPKITNAPYK
jgi:hypothetical protein